MERLFSPWRSQYIDSFKTDPESERCVFCDALRGTDDEKTLVVYRGDEVFIIMNLFPYNSGHLLIIPNRHTSDFQSLTASESLECQRLLQASQKALQSAVKPNAFNLGMNLGRPAGAGIEDHLHWHIVPRWNGDTNFLPILADVKLVSEDMHRLWKVLRETMPELARKQ